ncbi:peptide deformylase [Candidatus Jorgensenbacteria bacterium]|nr:peptide deformylase [Candidatus Jorgensenbacteria bacterium]
MPDKIWMVNNAAEEKILRSKIAPLEFAKENKKELRELVKRMRIAMKAANGVGLSANQIGIKKRIFIAQVPDDQGHLKFYTIVNPEIAKNSIEKDATEEGCLSVPLSYGIVERPAKITLNGFDLNGKKVKIKAGGLLARVFQHETDHLNGGLFIDKCKEVLTTTELPKKK